MSRSDLQTEASRANGSKSRGPVTEEGKLASSRNAVKHGILSHIVLLPGEDPDAFELDAQDLFDEHKPLGPTEQELVELMIVARWRRARIWLIEKTCMAGELMRQNNDAPEPKPSLTTSTSLAFVTMADNSRTLDLLNRYESRYDRQYFRAHRRLFEIQDRRMRNQPDTTPPSVVPTEPVAPGVKPGNSSCLTKGTQAGIENKASATRRPFYLMPALPAVFLAGAGIHPS